MAKGYEVDLPIGTSLGSELERLGYEAVEGFIFQKDVARETQSWLEKKEIDRVAVLPAKDSLGNQRLESGHYQIYIKRK